MIKQLLSLNGIELKEAVRNKKTFLYTKRSSVVEDFFALANMNQVTFELMNQKIEHEIRNNANRISNCEMSNIEKAVTASTKHLAAIEALDAQYPNAIPVFGGALSASKYVEYGIPNMSKFIPFLADAVRCAEFFNWHEGAVDVVKRFCDLCGVDYALIESYLGVKIG